MKNTIIAIASLFAFAACKNEVKENDTATMQPDAVQVDVSKYPQGLQEVFQTHGGLQKWSEMQTLTYTMPKKTGYETHTVDLKNRNTLVEGPGFKLGSDAGKVWIAQDTVAFPVERARFYHNLMFYFYAMPFILADDGIVYSDAPALVKDGISYTGLKIGYKANVGDSPDDEYVLYYHPETKRMEWLSYTVTYGKNEKSPNFKFIKYGDWQEVNGLILPQTLNWYNVENNLPTTVQTEGPYAAVNFTKVDIDKAGMDAGFYKMPQNGKLVD
ncbi:MAG: DUF6503 family protein [Nonlabens sp.]|nr:DUF6503 family protein [Nonlabens sp.]